MPGRQTCPQHGSAIACHLVAQRVGFAVLGAQTGSLAHLLVDAL
ncbi:hypothetical protein [Chitinimonas sp. PSY-7]